MLSNGCTSFTLCVALRVRDVLTWDATRNVTCVLPLKLWDRPTSPRQKLNHAYGTNAGRESPSTSPHAETYGSTRTAGPPREQFRSQYVVPSWPSVTPPITNHLLFSCT